jgi:hypothetical protein
VPETSILDVSSCGFANLLSECYCGHSARCAARFAELGSGVQRWEEIELELLAGCRVRGVLALSKFVRALRVSGFDGHFPMMARVHDICFLQRPVRHIVPLLRYEGEWRATRRRRLCSAVARCVGALALSCLIGLCVFLAQRELMALALHVDRLAEDVRAHARRTLDVASYLAAIGCIHSCLRWGVFGIGSRYVAPLVALCALLSGGLYVCERAGEYASREHGLPPLCGWMCTMPVVLLLAFQPLARAYCKQRLSDFLLTVG